MSRTVRVQSINKYGKVFLAEIAFSATEFLNAMQYVFVSANYGQAMSLIKRKYFLGLG